MSHPIVQTDKRTKNLYKIISTNLAQYLLITKFEIKNLKVVKHKDQIYTADIRRKQEYRGGVMKASEKVVVWERRL